jgi:hypothetical protein
LGMAVHSRAILFNTLHVKEIWLTWLQTLL